MCGRGAQCRPECSSSTVINTPQSGLDLRSAEHDHPEQRPNFFSTPRQAERTTPSVDPRRAVQPRASSAASPKAITADTRRGTLRRPDMQRASLDGRCQVIRGDFGTWRIQGTREAEMMMTNRPDQTMSSQGAEGKETIRGGGPGVFRRMGSDLGWAAGHTLEESMRGPRHRFSFGKARADPSLFHS